MCCRYRQLHTCHSSVMEHSFAFCRSHQTLRLALLHALSYNELSQISPKDQTIHLQPLTTHTHHPAPQLALGITGKQKQRSGQPAHKHADRPALAHNTPVDVLHSGQPSPTEKHPSATQPSSARPHSAYEARQAALRKLLRVRDLREHRPLRDAGICELRVRCAVAARGVCCVNYVFLPVVLAAAC